MFDRKRKSFAGRKDKKKFKEDNWSQKGVGMLQHVLRLSF